MKDNSHPIDFAAAERLPKGAERFFKTFCRFEFALKESRCSGEEGQRASANWDVYATELGEEFFESAVTSKQVGTLLEHPPKYQIVRNGALSFKDSQSPKDVKELFEAVRRVRNNLFHGGKSGEPDNDGEDPRRNEKLISEAQWVLEQALLRTADLRYVFEGRY